jgi:hypothetical protein
MFQRNEPIHESGQISRAGLDAIAEQAAQAQAFSVGSG